jgi:hypothetical protein
MRRSIEAGLIVGDLRVRIIGDEEQAQRHLQQKMHD